MSLRQRTLISMGVAAVILIALMYAVLGAVVLRGFERVESRDVADDVHRAAAAVQSDVVDLHQTVSDWALRDATYDYVLRRDQRFVSENFSVPVLMNVDVDVAVLSDTTGRVVYATAIDPAQKKRIAVPPDLLAQLRHLEPLRDYLSSPHGAVGMVTLARGPMMIAAEPVIRSNTPGPSSGTLVMGRFLDRAAMRAISQKTRLAVTLVPTVTVPMQDPSALPGQRVFEAATVVVPTSEATVTGYRLVTDTQGRGVASLRVDAPRSAYRQGRLTLSYLLIALILSGIGALAVTGWLTERFVLSRVAGLSGDVGRIAASEDPSARVAVSGRDEIAKLASETNEMLAALEHSGQELRKAKAELETRVEERTREAIASMEEQMETAEALGKSERRYRLLVENMGDAVFALDPDGSISFASTRAQSLTGYSRDRLMQMSYRELLDDVSRAKVDEAFAQADAEAFGDTIDLTIVDALGRHVPVEMASSPILGDEGQTAGVQWIARDVTERRRFESQLVRMANHDYLTGLFNRRRLEEELGRLLADARRGDVTGALLWIDLDHFKEVNDALGHRAGDETLVALAALLDTETRESSLLARLGGDEFAVVLNFADAEDAENAARRILEAIQKHVFTFEGGQVRITASAGIVTFPDHAATVEEALRRADLAMYRAKESGRARICVFEPGESWEAELTSRFAWAQRIEAALESDAFLVYAQPIVEPKTRVLSRYELLIRMRDEDGTVVLPGEFLPTAEHLGLINQIDRWMVVRAIRLIAEQRDKGKRVLLDVNISGRSLGDPELLTAIQTELETLYVDPSLLGLEVTETAAIADLPRAQGFIAAVKRLGLRLALDDFGAGFSSFYYLRNMALDQLKIDGSLIRDLPRSVQDQHLVKAVVELARGLGVRTTAEFVEDEETLLLVAEYGVDFAQGFHLGRPLPIGEVLETSGTDQVVSAKPRRRGQRPRA